ncbi:hypothetical protein IPN35_05205 [Candidatus Peregrinibacteria bacterium]|nr:MAG: hypothetical protein IPN35_05205 [Candidatus Peregrinibacteria bacterium]
MKKFITLPFFVMVCLFAPSAFAEDCTARLSENATEDSWQHQYMVPDQDGFVWQRAIIQKPEEKITLKEREPIFIKGIAQENMPVQIYLFSGNGQDSVSPPSENGTCFLEKADSTGFFQVEIQPEFLWTRMGKNMYIDAFYKTDEDWESKASEDKQAFGIGTGNTMRTVSVEADLGDTGACPVVCDFGITLGAELNPEDIDHKFIEQSFSGIGYMPVTIGRKPGENTFYGKTEYENADPYALQNISVQAVLSEGIKRSLLGNRNVGGEEPALQKKDIEDPDTIKKVLSDESTYSEPTKSILALIKTMLTEDKDKTERTELAKQILHLLGVDALKEPGSQEALQKSMLELFPKQTNEEEWSADFVKLLKFWTSSTKPNECLVADDEHYYYNFSHVGSVGFRNFNNGFDLCDFIFVEGIDPILLVTNQSIQTLRPIFHESVHMSLANRFFTNGNAWKFSPEEKKTVQYGYQLRGKTSSESVMSSCVQGGEVSELLSVLSNSFVLSDAEQKILKDELLALTPNADVSYLLELQDPKSIAELFSWEGNGLPLKVLQFFFRVTPNACSSPKVGEITDSAQNFWEPLHTERDAFEAGIFTE